jgi:signal transduction histidine kinase
LYPRDRSRLPDKIAKFLANPRPIANRLVLWGRTGKTREIIYPNPVEWRISTKCAVLPEVTMKNLQKVFLPRLTKRITLWMFVSILGIEAVILLPSISRQRQNLFAQQAATSTAMVAVLQQNASRGDLSQHDANLIANLQGLHSNQIIRGAALYHRGTPTPIAIIGESPELTIHTTAPAPQTLNQQNRYEVSHTILWPKQAKILVLRHDTTLVNQAVYTYTIELIALIGVISAVVAGSLMVVLQYQIIRPIVWLRWDLLQAGESVTEDLVTPEFVSDRYIHQDEFADMITAFQQMFQQISNQIGAQKHSESVMNQTAAQLQHTLQELQSTQTQLVQGEKMSSLGQLVAGVAHEINNPMNFIHGNLEYVGQVTRDLLGVIQQYQTDYPQMTPAIRQQIEVIDLDFVQQDLPKLLQSMQEGAHRIQELVLSFRNFSRLDESAWKPADLNLGWDSTLMLIQHRLQATSSQLPIQVIKQYADLPVIECYPAQINQVFLALLHNAIDALEFNRSIANRLDQPDEDPPMIEIKTQVAGGSIKIEVTDNGTGMSETTLRRAFDPFFTTKDVGAGQGLGLAISYQIIVDAHGGELFCQSVVNHGTRFTIHLPIAAIR